MLVARPGKHPSLIRTRKLTLAPKPLEYSLCLGFIEFLLKHLNHNPPLKFVGGSKTSIFRRPGFSQEGYRHELLNVAQASLGVLCLDVSHDGIHQLLGILDSFEVALDAILLGPLHCNDFIELHQSNRTVHISISVAANTAGNSVNELAVSVSHFHVLDGNVLSPLQLDKILLTVNDAETSICHKLTNVTSVEPTIGAKFLNGLFRHHVVSQSNIVTLGKNFATTMDAIAFNITGISL
mmetsp:Transcript_3620/g.7025  ORF Transcript_3620/g.7025 Transcript_3620/m.7025 type:complete len:238 (+) Transcript_3620:2078-2791(+)